MIHKYQQSNNVTVCVMSLSFAEQHFFIDMNFKSITFTWCSYFYLIKVYFFHNYV